jgi:hypothetical protein
MLEITAYAVEDSSFIGARSGATFTPLYLAFPTFVLIL